MTQINVLVKKVDTIAKSGNYGDPRDPSFMNKVFKNHMQNISSPIKAEVFHRFYRTYKTSQAIAPVPFKMTGANKVKELIKKTKGVKKEKKNKSPKINVQAILAAKEKYQKKMKATSLKR